VNNEALALFDQAVDGLRKVYLELASYLSDRKLVRHIVRTEAGALANDILKQCGIFREAHILSNSPVSILKEHPLANHQYIQKGYVSSIGPNARLIIAYKGLFFFIRAYQDALYRVLLEIETSEDAGRYRRMISAISENDQSYKADNPVGALLASSFPEYLEWFLDWRKRRDSVKLGAGFHISGPEPDIGVGFNIVTRKGGIIIDCSGTHTFRISDITKTLDNSAKLARLALERACEKCSE